ncbi:MAG: UV DNA damage repair endonuclease UvsE [bacterium]|nr:UV DNA damage repair endonuclease UvsE [bacterium]
MSYRIASCCQLGELTTNRKGEQVFKQYDDCKVGTITAKSMTTLSHSQQRAKFISKLKQNLSALRAQIKRVATLPDNQKMFRITSDLFPLYTHLDYNHLYDAEVLQLIKNSLSLTGKMITDNDIRVSTHPSQYTTLSSDKDHVIDNSIRDLESHVFLFECLGLNPVDHGVVINIHANGKSFTLPDRAKHLFQWLSIENDEKQAGHEKCLTLCEKYNIRYVFDLHHYYCETGEYLDINSVDYQRIQATWPDGVRPIIHLSQSRGDTNKREQCAHSDMITDIGLIEYFADWLYHNDCDLEAKYKNVAVSKLCEDVKQFTDFN